MKSRKKITSYKKDSKIKTKKSLEVYKMKKIENKVEILEVEFAEYYSGSLKCDEGTGVLQLAVLTLIEDKEVQIEIEAYLRKNHPEVTVVFGVTPLAQLENEIHGITNQLINMEMLLKTIQKSFNVAALKLDEADAEDFEALKAVFSTKGVEPRWIIE